MTDLSLTPITDAGAVVIPANGQELCPASLARNLEIDRDRLADELDAIRDELAQCREELHELQQQFLTRPRRY